MGWARFAAGLALAFSLRASAAPRELTFEPNLGQFEPEVRFLARGVGGTLFLTDSEAVLALRGEIRPIQLRWKHGRRMRPQGEEASQAWVQRFEGSDPGRWRSSIPTYRAVRYREIYPGIDLLFEGRDGEVEFSFDVHPGADASRIAFSIDGASAERSGGALVLRAGSRQVHVLAPKAFEISRDGTLPFEASLRQAAPAGWGFALGRHRASAEVLIDPVLAYGTYLGGNVADEANAVALDAAGNVFLAGATSSTNFPRAGGLMPYDAGSDAFVASFDPTGQKLRFSTYLGGSDEDTALAVAIDGSGNIYVGGKTRSANFPARANPYTYQGYWDGFLTKLAPSDGGYDVAYSTWIGSGGNDQISALQVDDAGYLYLAGCMADNSNVVNPWRALRSGVASGDAFAAELAPSGFGVTSAPTFFTYLGGSGFDCASSLALDSQGNLTVAGTTQSPNFPVANAFQRDAGGSMDGFVTTYAPGGQSYLMSTYLGGGLLDTVNGVAADGNGRLSVVGQTDSPDFPVTPGSFQPFLRRDAGYEAFFAQIDPSGTLSYSTFFGGGGGQNNALAVATTPTGGTYVAGWTGAGDFPLLNSLQARVLPRDAFLLLFDATPTLIYSTVYGGTGSDYGNALAVASDGSAWMAGSTSSIDLPTQQPWQPSFSFGMDGGSNAFLARIALPPPQVTAFNPDAGPSYGGKVVSIVGSGFLAQTQVSFGGADASVIPTPPSNLSAVAPPHPPGVVDVVITNPDGQKLRLPAIFTYYSAPLAVLSPTSVTVDAGQSFTLDGTGSMPSAGATLTSYLWTQPAGPAAIAFAAGATQALALSEPGAYQVGLQVVDSSGVPSEVALTTIQVQGSSGGVPTYHFGCGCGAGGVGAALGWGVGLLALRGRRRASIKKLG